MNGNDIFGSLPDFASIVLSISLGAIAVWPQKQHRNKKTRITLVVFLVVCAFAAFAVSTIQKAATKKEDAKKNNILQSVADKLNGFAGDTCFQQEDQLNALRQDIEAVTGPFGSTRPRVSLPPLIYKGATIDPLEPGVPRRMDFEIENSTGRSLRVQERNLPGLMMLHEPISQLPSRVREQDEEKFYNAMVGQEPTGQTIPTFSNGFESLKGDLPPLTQEQVDAVHRGYAVQYYLEQVTDTATGKPIFELCGFIDRDGQFLLCRKHNLP